MNYPPNGPPPGGYGAPPPGGYGAPTGYGVQQPYMPGTGGPMMMAQPGAMYGIDPVTGMPFSDKSKVVAGLLQLFAGGFGAGRFYTGHYGIAIAQLLTLGGCGVWALIDGIMLLTGRPTDAQGRPLQG